MPDDLKLSELPLVSALAAADLVYLITDDGSGGWVSRGMTAANLYGNIKVPVVIKPQAESAWLSMNPADAHADAMRFNIGFGSFANFNGGDNVVHRIGVNVANGGGRIDGTRPSGFLSFEQDYEQSDGGARLWENHWEGVDEDGTTYRWLSHSFEIGALATTSGVLLRAQRIELYEESGTIRAFYEFANDRVQWIDIVHRMETNGQAAMIQKNAAGTGYAALIGLDSSNRVTLGLGGDQNPAGILVGHDLFMGTGKALRMLDPAAGMSIGASGAGNGVNGIRFWSAAADALRFTHEQSTWDWLFGFNSSAFYLRDALHSNVEPLRIEHSAPSDTIRVKGSGAIGFGLDPGGGTAAGDIYLKDGAKIRAGGTTTGVMILASASDKLGFFGATPVTRPTALTATDSGTVNSGDSATDDVIENTRTRVDELEDKLQALGLVA